MNKRVFVESLIVGILLILGYYGWQILNGMFLTLNYKPDVIETYTTVDMLDQKVTFGTSNKSSSVYWLLGCIGLSAIYYGIRIAMIRTREIR